MSRPVGVVGGGGFGQALARAAARNGHPVILWSRSPREPADPRIRTTTDLAELVEAELVFVAVPSSHAEPVAETLGEHVDGRHLLVHISRGLVGDGLTTVGEVLAVRTAARRIGALAGPLVAPALAAGDPGAGVVGTRFPEVAAAVREAIGTANMHIYKTDDLVGVEIASAMVGLTALMVGFGQAIGLGPGTLAVLATRGVYEAARVGMLRGAWERTFSGLAGYGDLLAAVAGDGRPEVLFGRALASGGAVAEAARDAGAHVEGISIARNVAQFAERRGVEAPIAAATVAVLEGKLTGQAAIERLMQRPHRDA